jgi:hypothetical protein
MNIKKMSKEEALKLMDELKAYIEGEGHHPLLWKPKHGDHYYFSDEGGVVIEGYWDDSYRDVKRYISGNTSRTDEDARQIVEIRRADVRIRRRIAELNDGWTPDWDDTDHYKHCVLYSPYYKKFNISCQNYCKEHHDDYYMKSRDIAEQMIEEHADDYKIIWGIK